MMKGSWFSPEVGTHRQINPYLVNSSSPEELEPLLAADHHDRVQRGRVLRRQVEVVLGYLRRSWQNAEKPPSVGDALELVVARNLEVETGACDEVLHGLGDENLGRPGVRRHPRTDRDRDTRVHAGMRFGASHVADCFRYAEIEGT